MSDQVATVGLAKDLAHEVLQVRYEDIPSAEVHQVKRLLNAMLLNGADAALSRPE